MDIDCSFFFFRDNETSSQFVVRVCAIGRFASIGDFIFPLFVPLNTASSL